MQEIYFDNSATTQVLPEVAELAYRVMTEDYGNPSSLHKKGLKAAQLLAESRRQLAACLGVDAEEIYFTGSGTEADNIAILGLCRAQKRRGKHIITTAVEHPAVLNTCRMLEAEGFELTVLPVDEQGAVRASQVKAALRDDTILVSVMLVNNELGTIMPVAEIGAMLKNCGHKVYFHVDAVQAFGKIPIKPRLLGIDLLAASGHKIHAPKGVGFLYKAKPVRVLPVMAGGGQEQGLRSSTENLPGIAALAKAAVIACGRMDEHLAQVKAVRQAFLKALAELDDWQQNSPEQALPYVLNLAFGGIKSEVMLHSLAAAGLSVSSGSACGAKKDSLSPVLTAAGFERARIEGSLRFSFSQLNTVEEALAAAEIVKKTVSDLRQVLK